MAKILGFEALLGHLGDELANQFREYGDDMTVCLDASGVEGLPETIKDQFLYRYTEMAVDAAIEEQDAEGFYVVEVFEEVFHAFSDRQICRQAMGEGIRKLVREGYPDDGFNDTFSSEFINAINDFPASLEFRDFFMDALIHDARGAKTCESPFSVAKCIMKENSKDLSVHRNLKMVGTLIKDAVAKCENEEDFFWTRGAIRQALCPMDDGSEEDIELVKLAEKLLKKIDRAMGHT